MSLSKTNFEDIENVILQYIKNSEKSIYALLAWLTNPAILIGLQFARKNNIDVKIIVSNSPWNLIAKDKINQLIQQGAEIKSFGSNDTTLDNFSHFKLCVIDEKYILNGSFNWTKKATKNNEAYTVIEDTIDAKKCIDKFEELWSNSEKLNWQKIEAFSIYSIEDLENFEDNGASPETISINLTDANDTIKENNQIMNIVPSSTEILPFFNDNYVQLENGDIEFKSKLLSYSTDFIGDYEYDGMWYKIKFQQNNQTINVAIERIDLIELLKNIPRYKKYWFKNYFFPLSILNEDFCRLTFEPPVHLIKLDNNSGYNSIDYKLINDRNSRCSYKISIEHNNLFDLKAKMYMDTDILDKAFPENDHFIK